jgi:hypothetical protein
MMCLRVHCVLERRKVNILRGKKFALALKSGALTPDIFTIRIESDMRDKNPLNARHWRQRRAGWVCVARSRPPIAQ